MSDSYSVILILNYEGKIENERDVMSDYIIRIIPTNPYYHIEEEMTYKIVYNLKVGITADDIELKQYGTPVFIDCGSNLEKIICPLCGAAIDT